MIKPFLIGFATTFKAMFKKPVSVNYPDQKVPMFPKWRGKQVLMRDEDGLEKCVACGLCAVACPADAIYLEAAENDGSVMAGPRYAKVYQIHKTRCIFCGYCEEACPVSAIFMGKDYELAVYSNKDFIWDKQDLLVPRVRRRSSRRGRPVAGRAGAGGRARRCRMKPFLDALDERVLICDGAMGTMLYAKGIFLNRCFDELNLTQPDLGRRGAPGLRARRRRHPRDQHVRRQSRQAGDLRPGRARCTRSTSQGVRMARQAARDQRLRRRRDRPARRPRRAVGQDRPRRGRSAISASRPQALAEGGVDLFMLETFRDRERAGARRCARCAASRRCRSWRS